MASGPGHAVLTHTIRVALPPERAIRLFTPAGERLWVEHWKPFFPGGDPPDDGDAPGTVFATSADGHETTWVVIERSDDERAYARVTPGVWAGLVRVRCRANGASASLAEVTYDMTALTDDGRVHVTRFAERYPTAIGEWERLIADVIATGRAG
jgi:hypothetical protein